MRKIGKRKLALFGLITIGLVLTAFVPMSSVVEVSAKQWTGLNQPWGVAIGDYDNDGSNDIAFTENGGHKVTVYKSDGATIIKQWTSADKIYNPRGVAIGDYNNDGLNELAFANGTADVGKARVLVYKSDFALLKQWTGLNYPDGIAIGDYNNDGLNDLAFSEYSPTNGNVTVYKSDGTTVIKKWTGLTGPCGVAIGDCNNDGLNDLAFAESQPPTRVTVYKSDTTMIKQWTGLSTPMGVAIGDYDNDGLNDLAFSEWGTHKITVYKSDFIRIIKQWVSGILSTINDPRHVAIGDYDNDGLNDFAFVEETGNRVTVYYQPKSGTVVKASVKQWVGLGGPWGVAIGDYDNDGLNDLAFSEMTGGRVSVYESDGTLIRQWTGLSSPSGVAIGDYNNDGLSDIAITEVGGLDNVTVYRNDGTTIIRQWSGLRDPYFVAMGDYNNDGFTDLAFSEYTANNVTVYDKDGARIMRWRLLGGPLGVAIGDYDNDGLNDLAIVEYNLFRVTVYKNDGTTVIKQWTGLNLPYGTTIGDYDKDGLNDLAIVEYAVAPNGNVTVYKSDGTSVIKRFTGLNCPTGVAIGDYNNDGLNDFAIVQYSSNKVAVYYQTEPALVSRVPESTIVTLRGTLTDDIGNPIQTGSIRVTLNDSRNLQVWQDVFDDVIDNGRYNIQLGARATPKLMLVKGQIYSVKIEVDVNALTFNPAHVEVIFGDNSPADDIIKFVAC